MSREAKYFILLLGEKSEVAGRQSKIRCGFCDREYVYNLTKFKQHLYNGSCPKVYQELKSPVEKIHLLGLKFRNKLDTAASLYEAVEEAKNVLAMILRRDNNPFGIPLGGSNDADPHTDEDPLADEDTGGMMAEGTRGEQIATTDGPIVGTENGESSKGGANTLPEVDVSSSLNLSQENAEEKFAALKQENVNSKATIDALKQENAHLKRKFAALEQENVKCNARIDALESKNADIIKLLFGDAGTNNWKPEQWLDYRQH